jgi:hypothetical protein
MIKKDIRKSAIPLLICKMKIMITLLYTNSFKTVRSKKDLKKTAGLFKNDWMRKR